MLSTNFMKGHVRNIIENKMISFIHCFYDASIVFDIS